MATRLIHVAENGTETILPSTTPIIGWRAHYAGGLVYTSEGNTWLSLPTTGLILFSVIEQGQYAPGLHYRGGLQAEWYGYVPSPTETFYIIDRLNLSQLECELNWPLSVGWKRGAFVSDAEMEAAFDADSPQWAV